MTPPTAIALAKVVGTLVAAVTLNAVSASPASAQCLSSGTNQTCTNSTTLSGFPVAIADTGSLTLTNTPNGVITTGNGLAAIYTLNDATVTNSGTISAGAGATGIMALHDAIVANSGTISGGTYGITANNNASVTNSGTISGGTYGISATNNATVTNSGSILAGTGGAGIVAFNATVTNSGVISGGAYGIYAVNNGTVTNSGTISGNVGIFADAIVTNSGTIVGTGGTALQFTGAADTLTILPGSKIIGAINLAGGGDTVNFRGGNHNLTFDTLAGATVTGTTPFAVSGNRAAAIDPTPFAAAGALLTDFTRSLSSLVPSFDNQTVATGGTAPNAFAAPDAPSNIVADTFASLPGLSAYASDGPMYKAPTVIQSDGTAVWARGFGGQRIQQADGVLLHNTGTFFGGAMGVDKQVLPDLRIGAFIGAGSTRSTVDVNSGGTDSNLGFAGAHARYTWGASFLNFAVQGGGSRNESTRNISNNLAPGALETAKASYNGWYVSPDLTYGYRIAMGEALGAQHALIPSAQIRYLYGSYGGRTETGSTANLTVNSQTVQNLEERVELKLTRTTAVNSLATLQMYLTGGMLGVQRIGDNVVDAVLLGQAIPFATPGKRDIWGGFGGAGLEFRNANVAVFVAGEYLSLSNSSSVASGKAGLRVSF